MKCSATLKLFKATLIWNCFMPHTRLPNRCFLIRVGVQRCVPIQSRRHFPQKSVMPASSPVMCFWLANSGFNTLLFLLTTMCILKRQAPETRHSIDSPIGTPLPKRGHPIFMDIRGADTISKLFQSPQNSST